MPKNLLTNARSCAACGRLMARKRGKRTTCSQLCQTTLGRRLASKRQRGCFTPSSL